MIQSFVMMYNDLKLSLNLPMKGDIFIESAHSLGRFGLLVAKSVHCCCCPLFMSISQGSKGGPRGAKPSPTADFLLILSKVFFTQKGVAKYTQNNTLWSAIPLQKDILFC